MRTIHSPVVCKVEYRNRPRYTTKTYNNIAKRKLRPTIRVLAGHVATTKGGLPNYPIYVRTGSTLLELVNDGLPYHPTNLPQAIVLFRRHRVKFEIMRTWLPKLKKFRVELEARELA